MDRLRACPVHLLRGDGGIELAEQMLLASGLSNVLGTKINAGAQTYSVAVQSTDGRRYELEFTPECAASLVAVLLDGLGRLYELLPADRHPSPTLVSQGLDLAMSPAGDLALKVRMSGAGEIVFPLDAETIANLHQLFGDAVALSNRPHPN